MEDFKKRQFGFLLQLILLSIVVFGLHSFIIHYFFSDFSFFYPVWQIYVFHFIITAILYTLINYKYSAGNKSIFNLFTGLTLLKMILSVVFLLPLLISDIDGKQPDVMNFFAPYFVYLFFEVYALTSFLQKQ